jgi:hypothetical protein
LGERRLVPVVALFRVQGSSGGGDYLLSLPLKVWVQSSGEVLDLPSGSRHEPIGAATGSEEVISLPFFFSS